jgi:hypothetical protein
MKKYVVQVTESINHQYEFEVETEEEALEAYARLNDAQLKTRDIDGDSSWDRPWDVYEVTE